MKSRLLTGYLVIFMFVLSACSPQAAAGPTATVAAPTATSAPTQPPAVTLNVFAASSLTGAFGEIGKAFQAGHPGVTVTFNFAGSQTLAAQINSGAPVDVFASASQDQMDLVTKTGRINASASTPFANNRLVVIFPKANSFGIKSLADLAKPGLKLVLADKSVPAGQYALTFLDNAVKAGSFGATFKTDVLKNVVSYELDVKSVLSKVQLGEADAGIVYTTDAAGAASGAGAASTAGGAKPAATATVAAGSQIGQLAIPDALNVIAVYPIAVVKASRNLPLAQAFVEFMFSTDGQAILSKYGFIPVH